MDKRIDLRAVFLGLQEQMAASLTATRQVVQHPGAKGEAAELHWLTTLNNHLPIRYRADKAFVLDCDGKISDQIDVVIYDRQYSPFLFNQNNAKYVPAESVYAVFEVRQELNAGNFKYASEKARSVRGLRRTSAPILHAGGKYGAKEPPPIIAGILALGNEWNPSFGDPFVAAIRGSAPPERLDLGCALRYGGFDIKYAEGKEPTIAVSKPDTALIFFFLKLLARLQQSGTVGAIDLGEYGRAL